MISTSVSFHFLASRFPSEAHSATLANSGPCGFPGKSTRGTAPLSSATTEPMHACRLWSLAVDRRSVDTGTGFQAALFMSVLLDGATLNNNIAGGLDVDLARGFGVDVLAIEQ